MEMESGARFLAFSIYHYFILSNFSYCPLSWHFCGETHTKKLERIQEREHCVLFIMIEKTKDNGIRSI